MGPIGESLTLNITVPHTQHLDTKISLQSIPMPTIKLNDVTYIKIWSVHWVSLDCS